MASGKRDRFYEARKVLLAEKGRLRCQEVRVILEGLGFQVRDGNRGGHKIFTHEGLPEFQSGSYNCGHGRNPEVLPAYIAKILRTLEQHENAVIEWLEENR